MQCTHIQHATAICIPVMPATPGKLRRTESLAGNSYLWHPVEGPL